MEYGQISGCIKQIGRGSFSNVYLCKYDDDELDELVKDTDTNSNDKYYIVKEIRLNVLVNKYKLNNNEIKRTDGGRLQKFKRHKMSFGYSNTVTNIPTINNNEEKYYYKRLQELIESEIEILETVEHKNIIEYYNHKLYNDIYYLYMEYCELGDVYNILKNFDNQNNNYTFLTQRNQDAGMNIKFVYEFTYQISNALNVLAKHGIIHRDIKLHNILLKLTDNKNTDNARFVFKLSDFGFACYDLSLQTNIAFNESTLGKKYFKVCGTPYYMSPELMLNISNMENFTQYTSKASTAYIQSHNLFYNNKVDIWSLGICIYELLVNNLPFSNKSVALSNVKTINDLVNIYSQNNAQEIFDKLIFKETNINVLFKTLIKLMLTIDITERIEPAGIITYLDKNQELFHEEFDTEIKILNRNLIKIGDGKFNQSNTNLKQHVAMRPINKQMVKSMNLSNSWEEINHSNFLGDISVDDGFLKWLHKKI